MYAEKSLNEEHFTRIRKFREQYIRCFVKRRDVMCSLTEAVKQTSHLNSFVELSLAPTFRHQWPSIYAITDAEIDTERLNLLCLAQVPVRESLYYALDVMNVRRAESQITTARGGGLIFLP